PAGASREAGTAAAPLPRIRSGPVQMTRPRDGGRSGAARRSGSIPPPSRDWAYFFDIDGTLVDIAESPAGAWLDADLLALIARLGRYAHRLVRAVLSRRGARYRIQTGKRVVEMKPAGRDKGIAVLEFMHERPFRGRTPIFLGDDITDEYGFTTVNRLHGHSVKVGRGRTVARWRLRDVRAVRAWLEQGMVATAS